MQRFESPEQAQGFLSAYSADAHAPGASGSGSSRRAPSSEPEPTQLLTRTSAASIFQRRDNAVRVNAGERRAVHRARRRCRGLLARGHQTGLPSPVAGQRRSSCLGSDVMLERHRHGVARSALLRADIPLFGEVACRGCPKRLFEHDDEGRRRLVAEIAGDALHG